LKEFFDRYPQDPRAAELRQYERRIALDRAERRLQLEARGPLASSALLPVERLYLKARDMASDAPEAAIKTLESLVALYGAPPAASDADPEDRDERERETLCVALAERRIKTIRAALAEQVHRHLAALRERLDAAGQLSATDASRATDVYRAIIDLHGGDAWAAEIVDEARRQLNGEDRDSRSQ
jgi:hypothetical protein